jgi:hypothetical protein
MKIVHTARFWRSRPLLMRSGSIVLAWWSGGGFRQSISGVVTPRPAPARALVIGGKTPRGLLPSGDNPFKHCGGRFALTGLNGAVCPRWARLHAAPGTLSASPGRALPLANTVARAPLRSAPGGLHKRLLLRFGAHLGRFGLRCSRSLENARRTLRAASAW